MPQSPGPKLHAHPQQKPAGRRPRPARDADGTVLRYAELHCLTNFSFLRGASHPEELVTRAAELGYAALAITDRNSLAGVVRAHVAAKEHNLHLLIGAEITPRDAPSVVLLAPDRTAYGRLARLITRGRLRTPKGQCAIYLQDLADLAADLIAIVLPDDLSLSLKTAQRSTPRHSESAQQPARCHSEGAQRPRNLGPHLEPPRLCSQIPRFARNDTRTPLKPETPGAPPFQGWGTDPNTERPRESNRVPTSKEVGHPLRLSVPSSLRPSLDPLIPQSLLPLLAYREIFADRLYLAAELAYDLPDDARLAQLAELSTRTGIPLVAANNVHYHVPERRYLQDVLTCIRAQCTLAEAGKRLFANAERHLRPLDEIARRYAGHPDLLARTVEIAERCTFSLDELRYEYPHELVPEGRTAMEHLERLTWEGAIERYSNEETERRSHAEAKESNDDSTMKCRPSVATRLHGPANWGDPHASTNVSRSDCLAKSHGTGRTGLQSHGTNAAQRTIRLDSSDASGGSIRPIEHRGGLRTSKATGVAPVPADGAGLADGAANPDDPDAATRTGGDTAGVGRSTERSRSGAPGPDPEPRKPRRRLDASGWHSDAIHFAKRAAVTSPSLRDSVSPSLPPTIRQQLEAELSLITELKYEHYFLTVWDLVKFARRRGILCQGRGSAANSAVCYCLGITAVDPTRIDLLFERFISRERNEPPDIDVDFEHERREEVFQYIYEKYGRERAGIAAEVITYRPRSAVRDVGKALGLSLDRIDVLAKSLDWWDRQAVPEEVIRNAGLDPHDRTIQMLVRLVRQILRFPRHLSQHVGGFVITETPLCEIVPLENGAMPDRTFIEWDKDDIDALGILKVDCLALGMLTAISKCFKLLNSDEETKRRSNEETKGRRDEALDAAPPLLRHSVTPSLRCLPTSSLRLSVSPSLPSSLVDIPSEDPAVYDMICAADTVGVFQIESRAQMSMLPRLRPRCFYDLVIEVAIVRPGPIQGGMVHPYLRRRHGLEPVTYPSEDVKKVLHKTLGVPIFQEQVMRLAVVAAGFTPGEADQLRRAMAAWRLSGSIEKFQLKLIRGMLTNGYSKQFAEQIYLQIRGFGEYGFPESHAASFALLVYASAWLKRYHPAAFCAAMLNAQPLGFYTPGQLIRDAIAHGVRVLPVDVNFSEYDCTLEDRHAGTKARRHEDSDGATERRSDEENVPAGPRTSHTQSEPRPSGSGPNIAAGAPYEVAAGAPAGRRTQCASATADSADFATWGVNSAALRLGLRLVRGLSAEKSRGIISARREAEQRTPSSLRRSVAGAPPFQGWGTDPNAERSREPNRAPTSEEVGHPSQRVGHATPSIPQSLNPSIPIQSIPQLARRPDVSRETLARLAAADAFRSLGLNRRQALWHILALDDSEPPLFADLEPDEPPITLPPMPLDETVVHDYDALGFSLNAHPIGLVRRELDGLDLKESDGATKRRSDEGKVAARAPYDVAAGAPAGRRSPNTPTHREENVAARASARPLRVSRAHDLKHMRHGQRVAVAGLVTVRQRPGTAKGLVFMTLEDETGMANLVIRPNIWKRDRRIARGKIALIAAGHVERQGDVIHVQVRRFHDLLQRLANLRHRSRDFH